LRPPEDAPRTSEPPPATAARELAAVTRDRTQALPSRR
jgi:hypothetical protein